MANKQLYINGVEVLTTQSSISGRNLTDDESAKFDAAWKSIKAYYNYNGKVDLFTEDMKEVTKKVLGSELVKRPGNQNFGGMTPDGGLGIRPISMADICGNNVTQVPLNTWDVDWQNVGWRLWLGNHAGNTALGLNNATDVLGAHLEIVQRDATNQIEWATLFWGVLDMNPSPKISALRCSMGKEVVGDHDIELPMRNTEARYADLGRAYYFSCPDAFSVGVYIRALIAGGIGVSALRPIGVTIAPANRLKQLAANVPLGCASSG